MMQNRAFYSIIDALKWFCCEEPSALDFGLDIFRRAVAELPESVEHSYGKGPKGAENILKWYLVESSTVFQGNVYPQNLGKEDIANKSAIDASNIIFKQAEIVDTQSAVLQKLEDWRQERLGTIVLLTMQGRCHSKNFARLNRGEHIGDQAVGLINIFLDRQKAVSPRWSKADFVSCCLMLRACARSLIEILPVATRDSKTANWKKGFASFLHSGDGGRNMDDDFAVKIHAAISFRALRLYEPLLTLSSENIEQLEQRWTGRRE